MDFNNDTPNEIKLDMDIIGCCDVCDCNGTSTTWPRAHNSYTRDNIDTTIGRTY